MTTNRIADARARLEAIAADEAADPHVDRGKGTTWWVPQRVVPTAVVLIHGFTNCPLQYAELAPQLARRGHAVVVPRVRYHGYRDRMTNAIAQLRAEDWEADALRAIALAALCGERVVVAGISVAGTLCGWLAARTAIDHAIAVAPFAGVRELFGPANDLFGAALRVLPNRFMWWDPRRKEGQLPPHGYPRFSTRALGEGLRLSTELVPAIVPATPARRVTLVCNRADPAVNNPYAIRRLRTLRRCGIAVDVVTIDVPHTHDVIEPQIPQARPDLVYPTLIALVEDQR